jgi:hypothetical protein
MEILNYVTLLLTYTFHVLLATATAAVLPPRAATVVTKTPAVTAKAGAQTKINNELKVVAATATITATMTAMTMTIKT